MQFEKPLKVGKVWRYEYGLTALLDGEAIQTATVTPDATKATLQSSDFNGGVIGFYLQGVSKGACKVHIDYTTATRSDCFDCVVTVLDC